MIISLGLLKTAELNQGLPPTAPTPLSSSYPSVFMQKLVSCWEMHRLSSGQLFTATMASASCLGTTELKSCTGAACASKATHGKA